MLKMSKLLAGAIGAAAAVLGGNAFAVDAKGSVFGDLRYGIDHSDSSGPNSEASGVGHDTDFRELNGYIGVKASGGQGGWTAFGAYENYVDGQTLGLDQPRQSYAGVSGPFGTLAYGTLFTEYAKAGLAVDPFYNTSLASGAGGMAGTTGIAGGGINGFTYSSFGLSPLLTGDLPLNLSFAGLGSGGIQSNQLAYTSPAMAGVTVNVGVFFDEADDGATGAAGGQNHDYAAGVAFDNFGIKAGVQYLQINDDTGIGTFASTPGNAGGALESSAVRIHGGWGTQRFGVAASAERVDHVTVGGAPATDEEYLFVSGWFGVVAGTRIAASAGRTNETGFEGDGVQVGVFHDLFENFTVHTGGSMYDLKDGADDAYILSAGASYKFDLGFSTR